MKLVKIVRDKIGTPGLALSDRVTYMPAAREQVVEGLRKKLVEEALEYLLSPSAEELADVIEVANALRRWDLRIDPTELHEVGTRKLAERGGFGDGIGMFVS